MSPARPSERGAVSPARPSERGAVSPARPSQTSSLESLPWPSERGALCPVWWKLKLERSMSVTMPIWIHS